MANKEEITQQARELIAESLGVALNEVTLDSSFIDDLNADSLDIVELVMELEKRFGIEIPDDEAEKISTVRDAVNYIVDHIN